MDYTLFEYQEHEINLLRDKSLRDRHRHTVGLCLCVYHGKVVSEQMLILPGDGHEDILDNVKPYTASGVHLVWIYNRQSKEWIQIIFLNFLGYFS